MGVGGGVEGVGADSERVWHERGSLPVQRLQRACLTARRVSFQSSIVAFQHVFGGRAWNDARITVSATASWISSAVWRNWRHLRHTTDTERTDIGYPCGKWHHGQEKQRESWWQSSEWFVSERQKREREGPQSEAARGGAALRRRWACARHSHAAQSRAELGLCAGEKRVGWQGRWSVSAAGAARELRGGDRRTRCARRREERAAPGGAGAGWQGRERERRSSQGDERAARRVFRVWRRNDLLQRVDVGSDGADARARRDAQRRGPPRDEVWAQAAGGDARRSVRYADVDAVESSRLGTPRTAWHRCRGEESLARSIMEHKRDILTSPRGTG